MLCDVNRDAATPQRLQKMALADERASLSRAIRSKYGEDEETEDVNDEGQSVAIIIRCPARGETTIDPCSALERANRNVASISACHNAEQATYRDSGRRSVAPNELPKRFRARSRL